MMEQREPLDSLALQAWADTTEDGVVVLDTAGQVEMLNLSAQELLLLERVPQTVDDLLACTGTQNASLKALFRYDLSARTPRWGSVRTPKYPSRLLSWGGYPCMIMVRCVACVIGPHAALPSSAINPSEHDLPDLRTLERDLGFELLRQNRDTLSADGRRVWTTSSRTQ